MTPTEAGKRFTAKDVGRILAYESLERDAMDQQLREDELRNKATKQRNMATG